MISVFETSLGWIGLLAREGKLSRIRIAHDSSDAVLDAFLSDVSDVVGPLDLVDIEVTDWNPRLRRELSRYADCQPHDFSWVELAWPRPLTEFRQRVIDEIRQVPWGQTVSYGDLAERAGSPRAARAAGSVMASNRFLIVVPCHRVVATSGLGGFSGPGGLSLKRRLLDMEQSPLR